MAKEKKMVKAITPRDVDFAQWYTDIVKQAEMIDYSSVQGFMNILPNGYGIWELIVNRLDGYFKESGHQNVCLPIFIPESLLNKEKAHVTGFAPEVAWITHGGSEELQERMCARPTSETLFCDLYARIIQSYRDLPKLYNQWVSVVRWEKTTRPFLRTREFLWQEGHTAHETAEDSLAETLRMLDIYEKMLGDDMAIPVIKGQKTEKEKFAGAMNTYSVESVMYDGKALQTATSHDFGDGFAKCFNIVYTDRNNELKHVHQTSWGLSTRSIGALIMVHGDDDGLVIPPRIAPVQLVIIPIAAHTNAAVSEKASEINAALKKNYRTLLDTSDKSPGWKFSLHEMRGVALRLELGPKDLEKNSCVIVRRDNRQKYFVSLDELEVKVPEILKEMQQAMLEKATDSLNSKIYSAISMEEFTKTLNETPGFIKAMWCGERECEEDIKEQTGATSRVIPFEQERLADTCFCCGKKAEKLVFWGKAY